MKKMRSVSRRHHRFNIQVVNEHDADFHGWRRRRAERLEGREQIGQRIAHWLEDERCRGMLPPLEILFCKLSHARRQPLVPPHLFTPPPTPRNPILPPPPPH